MPDPSNSPSVPEPFTRAFAWTFIILALVLGVVSTAAMIALAEFVPGNPFWVTASIGVPLSAVVVGAVGGYILGRLVPASGASSVGGERR